MFRRIGCRRYAFPLIAILNLSTALTAQNTGSLRGKVTDQTGALIPGAVISAKSSTGQTTLATSGGDGSYQLGLEVGTYTVSASARGFATFSRDSVMLTPGKPQTLNISLQVEVVHQNVQVQSEGTTLDTAPSNNANTVVLKGRDLDALSDDPDELEAELQALAGPSAGPNGGQMYIDGFSAGQLPPKSAIREIRINQNPFSAQYDALGYGRVEVFTKPGTDKLHGKAEFTDRNSILSANNPFITSQPGYNSAIIEGNVGGPLGKKASFFLAGQRRIIEEVAVVTPECGDLASALPQLCGSTTVPNPHSRTNIGPRLDYQLTPSNTLTTRYQYVSDERRNGGIGQTPSRINLPSLGYNTDNHEQTLQLSDTHIFGAKVVNESAFQYLRVNDEQTPLSIAPELSVLGVLGTGGTSSGHLSDQENHYELQNYTSIVSGKHFWRFGARIRISQVSNQIAQNFNGTFTYPSLTAFLNSQPNQFSIATGQPLVSNTFTDLGAYVEEDWKVRANLTASFGLRYETQSAISDHHDFAPRVGLAWGIWSQGGVPKTVLRAGGGVFYDRFQQSLVLQAHRLDGSTQHLFVIDSPSFGPDNIPSSFDEFTGQRATVYRIDPRLQAPYVFQIAGGVEQELTKSIKLSLTYLNSRGLHQLITNNINAPLPGTFPANPVCPLGCPTGNVYEYQSEGTFKQQQLVANLNVPHGPNLSLFGFYTLNFAKSNTSGPGSFPSNPYDLSVDYGRTSFDVRHRLFFGGTLGIPFGFRLSPFIFAQSGSPYNITIPEDILGTSVFNARPGLAVGSPNCPALSVTNPFCFYIPSPGQAYSPIPIYFGEGRANLSINLRIGKTFGLGPRRATTGGGAGMGEQHGGIGGFGELSHHAHVNAGYTDHRYNLAFNISGRNIFNHQNLAPPVGVLSPQAFAGSSDFGHSIALAGGAFGDQTSNRRIDLQVQFSF